MLIVLLILTIFHAGFRLFKRKCKPYRFCLDRETHELYLVNSYLQATLLFFMVGGISAFCLYLYLSDFVTQIVI